MEYNVITAEAQQYGLSNDLLDIVCERLVYNSRMKSTNVDFSEVELNDFLQK